MCKFCGDEAAHSPASTSSKQETNVVPDSSESDEGFMEEVERELVIDDNESYESVEAGDGRDVAGDSDEEDIPLSVKLGRVKGKRPRESFGEESAIASPKRLRSEAPQEPTVPDLLEVKARIITRMTSLFTMAANLQETTEELVKRTVDISACLVENEKLKKTSTESVKQKDELTRVLWAVRDEYYKLRASSAKSQEKNEQLQENMRTLTEDYDTLKKEKDRAQAAADEHTKKSEELQRVLWAVREEYYKLKGTLEKAQEKSQTMTQRYEELSQQAKVLTHRNQELLDEVQTVKDRHEALKAQPNQSDQLARELNELRAECERLRRSEKAAFAAADKHKSLCEVAQTNYSIISSALSRNQEGAEMLRTQIRDGLDRETKLTAERDRLAYDKAQIVKDLERISSDRDRFREVHAQTIADKERLEKAIAQTEEERKRLAEEKAKFALDWDRLIVQRDNTASEMDLIRVERDAMYIQKLTSIAEKTRAEEALAVAAKERDALASERDRLLEEKSRADKATEFLRVEVGRLLDLEAKQRIEDTLNRAKNAELYDALLQDNMELRSRVGHRDKPMLEELPMKPL